MNFKYSTIKRISYFLAVIIATAAFLIVTTPAPCLAEPSSGVMGRPDIEAIQKKVTPLFVQNKEEEKRSGKLKAPAAPSRDLLGDQRNFFVYNFIKGGYDSVASTLRKVGGHCYVYVDNSLFSQNLITQGQIETIANTFDNTYYPTETAYFGLENSPGIDNDVKITILITRIYSSAAYIGYFDPTDELPDSQAQTLGYRSNQREMFYMNGYDFIPANPKFMHTLSHEFFHMIHYNNNPKEEKWVGEGLADLAAYIVGNREVTDKIAAFTKNPGVSLLPFDYSSNALEHYGASFLFMLYLYEQYRGTTDIERQNFTRNLTKSGDTSTRTIDYALASAGYPDVKFKDVFSDWVLTNYINPLYFAKYRYNDFIINIDPLQTHSGYPVRDRAFDLNYWGANYILFKYAASKSHVLEFSGAPGGIFYPRVCLFNKDGSVTVKNIVMNGDNKGFIDLAEFGVTYNSVLLVPSYTYERGPTSYHYAVGFAGPVVGIYPNPIFNDDMYLTVQSISKPQVVVKRSGGPDEKITMNYASKNLYTGSYHVVYSGNFEVSVNGEDENGLQGTVLTTFEVRKLQNRVLNMIAFGEGRGYFAARYDMSVEPSEPPKITVIPVDSPENQSKSAQAELKYLAGVRTFDNIPKNAYKSTEVSFAFKDIVPSNIAISQLGIYESDDKSASGVKICESYVKDGNLLAAPVASTGKYFLMYDDISPVMSEVRRTSQYIDLSVSDSGSGVTSENIKIDASDKCDYTYFQDEGILRLIPRDGCRDIAVTVTDRAKNSASFSVNRANGGVSADISSLYASPSPATTFANVTWQGGTPPFRIKIYDVSSNVIASYDSIAGRSYRWNLSNDAMDAVSNGIYYFSVEDSNNITAKYGKIAVLK